MLDLIESLRGETTILLSTHVLPEAEQVCDRIIIINQGRIFFDGTTQQLNQRHGAGKRVKVVLDGAVDRQQMERLGKIIQCGEAELVLEVDRDHAAEVVAHLVGSHPVKDVSISDPLLGTLTCAPAQPASLDPGAALVCSGSYALTQADLDSNSGSWQLAVGVTDTISDRYSEVTLAAPPEEHVGAKLRIFRCGNV